MESPKRIETGYWPCHSTLGVRTIPGEQSFGFWTMNMRTDDGGLIGRIQRSSLGYMNTMHTQKLLKRGVISFCWMIPSIMAVIRRSLHLLWVPMIHFQFLGPSARPAWPWSSRAVLCAEIVKVSLSAEENPESTFNRVNETPGQQF